MRRHIFAAALIVVASVALCGCTPRPASTSTAPDSSASSATSSAQPAAIRPMTPAEKRELIAPNFMPEVPVPFGRVVVGESQGDTAWDYEIIIDAPVAAVATWYQETYRGREWQVVGQNSPEAGSLKLTLTKNSAQTRVTISPADGGGSRVRGILGVGTPVLQTQ